MVWSWIPGNLALIGELTRQNAYIGIVSAVVGLVIAVPLGIASARWRCGSPRSGTGPAPSPRTSWSNSGTAASPC
jgi:hypothetical protein